MFRSIKNRRGSRSVNGFEGMEALESRQMMATIQWTGCGDGVTLNSKYNWQCNQLPGVYDTAVLSVSGSPQVKLTAGSFKVKKFIEAENLTVTGGVLEVGTGGTTLSGTLNLKGGQFGGNGLLSVTGHLNWSAGKILGCGGIDIAQAGEFNIDGTGPLELGRDVTNHGKIIWNSGNIDGTDCDGNTIANETGAVFRALGSTRFRSLNGPGLVDNKGTLVRDGEGNTRFVVKFNNSGTLNIAQGTLELWGGGDNTGARNVAEVGVLHYFGNFTEGTGSTLIGGGNTYWQGGTHTITGAWSMQSYLWVVGATVAGSAQWTIDGVLGWSHGRMEGSGGTVIGPGGKLEIRTDGEHEIARDITNLGVLIWNKGQLKFDGATVTNPVGSVFYVCADATAVNGAGINRIVNQGEVRKQLPTSLGFGGVTFDNSGLLNVRNGTMTLDQGTLTQLTSNTLSGGEWIAFNNATLSFSGDQIHTIGAGASVTRLGRFANIDALNTLTLNQGTLKIYGGGTMDITPVGGTFTNSGLLFLANTTALRIDGSFVQTSAGMLNIGIGGPNTYLTGRALAAHDISLAGLVEVTLELGYIPTAGDHFMIVQGTPVGAVFPAVISDEPAHLMDTPEGLMLMYL